MIRNIKHGQERILNKIIDEILWKEWDPIGVQWAREAARDEYSSYVPKVSAMVVSNKSSKEISDYLFNVETKVTGLPGNKGKCDQSGLLVVRARDKYLK